MSAHGSKLGVSEGYVSRNMVGITAGETDVSDLVQEYLMCDGKEPVKLLGRGAVAATIIEFCTMEGYDVGF